MSAILALPKMAVPRAQLVAPFHPHMSARPRPKKPEHATHASILSLTSPTQLRTFVEVQLKAGLWEDLNGFADSDCLLERNGPQESTLQDSWRLECSAQRGREPANRSRLG